MVNKQESEASMLIQQANNKGGQPEHLPIEPQEQGTEIAAATDAERIDIEVSKLARKAFEGGISPAERSELDAYLLDDALHGTDFAYRILGIQDNKEIVQFLAVRDQAIKDLGVDTVYSRIVNDLLLGTVHEYKECMKRTATTKKLADICSERYREVGNAPGLVETVRYLQNTDDNIARLQTRCLRNLATLLRAQNSICRTHANATMKINAQTVNVGQKQINVQIDAGQPGILENKMDDPDSSGNVIDR